MPDRDKAHVAGVKGLTSKRVGLKLAISPRTVDVYRTRPMRKYGTSTTPERVVKLLGT